MVAARTRWAPPLALLAVAALARLWQIDLTRFADDQATLLGSAAHAVAAGQLPLTTGMSFTIGIRHPPLATFLLVPPALLSRDPVLASAWMALLDALAVLFVYWTGRRIGGRRLGVAAALIYALEPAAIAYGRTVWNPDLVPLCAAIVVWGLVELQQRDNAWGQAAALFAIGCAAQLHPQAAALLVVWLALALAKRRLGWPSLTAVGGLALVLSPYVYLQLSSGWTDVRAALRYLQQPKQLDAQAFHAVGSLFSSYTYADLLTTRGAPAPPLLTDPLFWFFAVTLLAGLALTFAASSARLGPPGTADPALGSSSYSTGNADSPASPAVRGFGVRRRHALALAGLPPRGAGGALIVAGCFIAPVLAALDHAGSVEPHYLLVVLPSGCLLAAVALCSIRPRILGAGLLALALSWAGLQYLRFQMAVPEQALGANYGQPLRYSLRAAALAAAQPGMLYVSNRDEEAGVFGYLLPGRPQKRFDGRYTFVFPQDAGVYLADATLPFAYGQLGQPPQAVRTPAGRVAYGIFPSAALAPPSGLQPLDVDVGHALKLTGYQPGDLRGGQPSVVQLEWRVTDAHGPVPDDLRQFGHLVDAANVLWSTNADFRGYPRPSWQDGDVVLSAFALAPPPSVPSGGYWFDTGFYEPISGQRLPHYRDGQPAGSSARIGPLKVAGQFPPPSASQPLAVFGNGEIALLAVRQSSGGVELRWQALRKLPADYTVFVHVLDSSGALVAQQDSQPRAASYPTSLWDAGEVVDDPHPLTVASAPGLRLEIGLYTFPDLRRLPVDGGSDSVTLPFP